MERGGEGAFSKANAAYRHGFNTHAHIHRKIESIKFTVEDSEQCSSSTVTMLAHPAPDADSGSPCQAARAVRLPQPGRRRPVARAGLPVTAAGAGDGVRRSRSVSD